MDWVNRLWNVVDTSLIQRSLKCYGVSNKRDETDDWIFDYKCLEQVQSSDEAELLNDNSNDINDEDNEVIITRKKKIMIMNGIIRNI